MARECPRSFPFAQGPQSRTAVLVSENPVPRVCAGPQPSVHPSVVGGPALSQSAPSRPASRILGRASLRSVPRWAVAGDFVPCGPSAPCVRPAPPHSRGPHRDVGRSERAPLPLSFDSGASSSSLPSFRGGPGPSWTPSHGRLSPGLASFLDFQTEPCL